MLQANGGVQLNLLKQELEINKEDHSIYASLILWIPKLSERNRTGDLFPESIRVSKRFNQLNYKTAGLRRNH